MFEAIAAELIQPPAAYVQEVRKRGRGLSKRPPAVAGFVVGRGQNPAHIIEVALQELHLLTLGGQLGLGTGKAGGHVLVCGDFMVRVTAAHLLRISPDYRLFYRTRLIHPRKL